MDLKDFFAENKKCALAFSGGTDSAYLLHVAVKSGADVAPYFVMTDFQPLFELKRAHKITDRYGLFLRVLYLNILEDKRVCSNTYDRCYWCKRHLFGTMIEEANIDGYSLLIDGTNASDNFDERPGMRALLEFGVRSPLREAGLTKDDVRSLSKQAGLSTWNTPSYSCLATRIKSGTEISKSVLICVDAAEEELYNLNYRDIRVRTDGENALVQINKEQLPKALKEKDAIVRAVEKYFKKAEIDTEGR